MSHLIGIDLGGTKTEIIVLDANNYKELYRKRVPSPRDDYQKTVRNMADLVFEAERALDIDGAARVGVGIPGIVSRETGLVKNANSTWLIGHPLDRDLSDALDRPVIFENDANCFALSEAIDGAGKGQKVVFGVIIGTGTGGGIVVDGQVINGRNQLGGEWGHNQLPWMNEEELSLAADKTTFWGHCYCGRCGCIEAFLSGPGFKNYYNFLAKNSEESELSNHDIRKLYEDGDRLALSVMDVYEDRLARGLASVINFLDPDVIVLGGGMSNLSNLYKNVIEKISPYIFGKDELSTSIVKAVHGDSSGVRGAALLAKNVKLDERTSKIYHLKSVNLTQA
jgi:fructokinase